MGGHNSHVSYPFSPSVEELTLIERLIEILFPQLESWVIVQNLHAALLRRQGDSGSAGHKRKDVMESSMKLTTTSFCCHTLI